MNTAIAVYVALGALAASIVLSLAMGRLLRRLRLDREAAGEHPDRGWVPLAPGQVTDGDLPRLTPADLHRLWVAVAAAQPLTSADLDRVIASFEPCGAAGPCRLHEPDTCRVAGACCPTCPTPA